jgi:hypothetical protein
MMESHLVLAVTMILMAGVILYITKSQQSLPEKSRVQIVALLIILPTVLGLADTGYINNDTISMLLGTAIGYFFKYINTEA